MLKELYIKNIAVIDEVIIDFEKGFNVLTGETGAGKSILIDAINMVIGSRSNKELVRTGAEKAMVSATFSVTSDEIKEKLDEFGVDLEEEQVIVSRQISADGKSVCRVNGMMLPLASVKEIGELLVDIHGQNDNQKIMNKANHIFFLDGYGKYDALKDEYKAVFTDYKRVLQELDELKGDKEERERRLDLLEFQINEIESAKLKADEDVTLEERRNFLQNAEKIVFGVQSAYDELYGGEYQSAAYDLIMKAVKGLDSVKEYDENLRSYADRLSSVMAEIDDITGELKSFLNKADYSQGELDEVETRLNVINNLKRKFGNTIEEINVYLEKIKDEYEKLSQSEENTAKLTQELSEIEAKLEAVSKKLTDARKKAGSELEEKIARELADLDMPNVKFVVLIENAQYNKNGCDGVEFLISANAGEAPKPMNKIASGGELSRIMLAIKSVMADSEISETMIFDEIDTGVSGRAAQKIAEKIAGFSSDCQVFAVTHLAQIAAMADTHFQIKKEKRDEKTYTGVTKLSYEGRIEELGRIIGGVSVTQTTLKSAEEMLQMAENIKNGR